MLFRCATHIHSTRPTLRNTGIDGIVQTQLTIKISLPIITAITIEIGIRGFIQENAYLSEKNNFEIIIVTISHTKNL